MKHYKWLLACVALVAGALIVGCGGSSSTTISTNGSGGSATVTSSGGSTTATVTSANASPDDVYQACLNAIKGTAAESAGQTACAQARDAFAQCTTQASNAPEGTARDQALKACQEAANKATAALKSAP